IPVVDCIGTKKPEEHDTLAAAKWMGAEFRSFNPGYAATLNSKAHQLSQGELAGYYHLETNITLDQERNSPESIEAFHKIGSEQVRNIPDHIETIIVPAGSCNSVTGIMYGIARFRPKNLKKVLLMGIGSYGSSDPLYIYRRLALMETVTNFNSKDVFSWDVFHPGIGRSMAPYEVAYHNVNGGC